MSDQNNIEPEDPKKGIKICSLSISHCPNAVDSIKIIKKHLQFGAHQGTLRYRPACDHSLQINADADLVWSLGYLTSMKTENKNFLEKT